MTPLFFLRCFLELLSSIACFYSLYYVHRYCLGVSASPTLIGAFGAATVLAFFNTKENKKQQLKQGVLSSVIAAAIGVYISKCVFLEQIAVFIVVGLVLFVFRMMKISYPPAGAIALFPCISTTPIGYDYIWMPVTTGITIILFFSWVQNHVYQKINSYYGQ